MRKVIIRCLIVFGWLIAIFGALYLPHFDFFPFQEKSINIFAWGHTIDLNILSQFEKETGIKVNLSFYSSNEELLIKMKATGGGDYDLIMPSDYTVQLLRKEGLLQEIDRSALNFWSDLNPALLNHSYDPNNQFSIPFEWEIYGLGVNTDFFQKTPFTASWDAIYNKELIDYKIAVNNDPIEAVLFAAFYLYGRTDGLGPLEFAGIRELLLEQRKWVQAYSNTRADYFIATGNCPVALSVSSLIKRVRLLFPQVDFIVPQAGTFISIENFCIPKASSKQEYVYQLLNRLYTKESMTAHYDSFWFFPATLSPIDELDLDPYEQKLLRLTRQDFDKFHYIKNVFPQQKVRDLWVEVKSF